MTVNQRVASSSLAGGALLNKPAEMSACSLITSQFDSCNSCCLMDLIIYYLVGVKLKY